MNPGILKSYKPNIFAYLQILAALVILCISQAYALELPSLKFSVHRLESKVKGPTILIFGGIQGDEPGGFNAAGLIVTHYNILSGNVWVVPNLNFLSIIKRSRGVYGDLNRKFDKLSISDPEYATIQRVKKLIRNPDVDLVLNLHDGSGFYRTTYQDRLHNTNRWGQCIIIDQTHVEAKKFSRLSEMAQNAVSDVNRRLLAREDMFHLNNTKTAQGNIEMAKTLTYFAIKNKKPAFGIEASKSFITPKRAYYHLIAIESFFRQAGIKFQKNFSLTESDIKKAFDENIQVALNNRKILLKVENVRKFLNYIPLRKDSPIQFKANNPLMTIIPSGASYSVFHGNRTLTRLMPQYFDYDFSIDSIDMVIDGKLQKVPFGHIVNVSDNFMIPEIKNHRVNVIGFTKKACINETDLTIRKNLIMKKFSIDRKGNLFRVEVYCDNKFSGMVLVDFSGKRRSARLDLAYEEQITRKPLF